MVQIFEKQFFNILVAGLITVITGIFRFFVPGTVLFHRPNKAHPFSSPISSVVCHIADDEIAAQTGDAFISKATEG